MVPRPSHVVEQAKSGDAVNTAFSHLPRLHLLAHDVLLYMDVFAILPYLNYSLIGLVAIKLRGLAQDAMWEILLGERANTHPSLIPGADYIPADRILFTQQLS
jgi:hypothetical protein